MTGLLKIAKELYDSETWQKISAVLFRTTEIYQFDSQNVDLICEGDYVLGGRFELEALHLRNAKDGIIYAITFNPMTPNQQTVIIAA